MYRYKLFITGEFNNTPHYILKNYEYVYYKNLYVHLYIIKLQCCIMKILYRNFRTIIEI